MKKKYNNLLNIAIGATLCLFLAMPAVAQRGSNGGGGGGSTSRPAPSSGGGGGGGSSRPAASFSGSSSRPASMGSVPQRSSVQPQGGVRQVQGIAPRGSNGGYAPRTGTVVRGNYGYAPRTGATTVAGSNAVRGNYGYAPRVGTVVPRGATGYRTAPQIGYGNGGGYWGNHGYYHYNRGFYSSYYLPSIGFGCTVLPFGYYPFYYGDEQYYFSNGLYYQFDNEQYTVVEPPVGAQINTLPEKAQSIVINGQQYYELNGVYYQAVTKDDGSTVYQVAGKDGQLNTGTVTDDQQPQGPQMGDIVNQLPPDCRKIKVNGQKLYVSPDGVYYQELVDANGTASYKVVGLPTDEPEQN